MCPAANVHIAGTVHYIEMGTEFYQSLFGIVYGLQISVGA